MPYDLFISYSRRDDQQGQVRALKEQIAADYRDFAQEDLRCFFDTEAIASMDDWRHRILEGLRDSNLLLLVLSPAYLDSPYCEWEIVEFLKYEHSRSVGGQGVTPVYFVEIPGLDEPSFEQRAAAWLARVRRRNQVDLRPWYHEGVEALKQADVRARLDDLERSLHTRLSRLRRLREAPGNLPAHNSRFVGREAEMQRLHEAAGLGRFGVLTAVQGMGGVGKTALAIQYAYAYADFYSGGRWLVSCAGETSLAAAVRQLDLDLGLTLSDAEKRDDTLAARRVLAELERRTNESTKACSGEKGPPRPMSLLLLDNVDQPAVLQPPQSDLLTGRQWLHVVATTRSGADDFGNDPERLTVLSIDELPEDDALRLIESYQPGRRFPVPQERDAALELVKLLGGFTLAVEVVAVHLGERAGRVNCAAFLQRMKKEGLAGLDSAAMATKGGIKHGEKLVGATLQPTLGLLSEQERLVLSYAALLPPDSIPLPWLRALAAKELPELGRDAEAGYDDPWLSLVNHLLGLRLLQTVDLAEDGRTPRLVRMHRIVSAVVATSQPNTEITLNHVTLLQKLSEHCDRIASGLGYGWDAVNRRWEILCLAKFAEQLIGQGNPRGSSLVANLGFPLVRLSLDIESTGLLRNALREAQKNSPDCTPEICRLQYFLGELLGRLGSLDEAEPLIRQSLETRHRILGPGSHETWLSENNMGWLLMLRNNYADAEPFIRRARSGLEATLGLTHHHTLAILNNVAVIEGWKGNAADAEYLYRRVFEGMKQELGETQPDTQVSACNLGMTLDQMGRHEEAENLLESALANRILVLGADHPETIENMIMLARHYSRLSAFEKAEEMLRKVMETRERTLGPDHKDTAEAVNMRAVNLANYGDLQLAEHLYRRALAGRERALGLTHPDTCSTLQSLISLLEKAGRTDDAEPLRAVFIDRVASNPNATPLTLRQLALECFNQGDYVCTEVLLRQVLAKGFEVPGTNCHLARALVMGGREAEALAASNQAWAHRAEAPGYVVPRILWFQVAFVLLDGASPAPVLGRLKTALQAENAHMVWTMDPVLTHLQPNLSPEAQALLTALVAALSDPAQLVKLDEFPEWRAATPLPLD